MDGCFQWYTAESVGRHEDAVVSVLEKVFCGKDAYRSPNLHEARELVPEWSELGLGNFVGRIPLSNHSFFSSEEDPKGRQKV